MIPKHLQQLYLLVLKEGYRPRQMDMDLFRGQLTGVYRITLKKKKKPVLSVLLTPEPRDQYVVKVARNGERI